MRDQGAQECISPQMEDQDAGEDNVARVSAHKIQKKDMPSPSQKRKRVRLAELEQPEKRESGIRVLRNVYDHIWKIRMQEKIMLRECQRIKSKKKICLLPHKKEKEK